MSEAVINNKPQTKVKAFDKRIHEVDFFRGFLILLVLLDHLFNRFGTDNNFCLPLQQFFGGWYLPFQGRGVIRFLALAGFCFTSGVSCAFSKSNWKRAIEMLTFYAILTLGSNLLEIFLTDKGIVNFNFRIDFNVIGVLAFSTFFYCLVQNRSWKALTAMTIGTFLLAFYVFPTFRDYSLPNTPDGQSLYGWTFYAPAFFRPEATQADWMPLLPFMTFFLMGAIFSYFFYKEKKQSLFPKLKRNWERPICFMGRHSLLFYLGHQLVYIPIFMLLNAIPTWIGG
jgi:uncharacterized membrane protein